jgi:hypothetical protein
MEAHPGTPALNLTSKTVPETKKGDPGARGTPATRPGSLAVIMPRHRKTASGYAAACAAWWHGAGNPGSLAALTDAQIREFTPDAQRAARPRPGKHQALWADRSAHPVVQTARAGL